MSEFWTSPVFWAYTIAVVIVAIVGFFYAYTPGNAYGSTELAQRITTAKAFYFIIGIIVWVCLIASGYNGDVALQNNGASSNKLTTIRVVFGVMLILTLIWIIMWGTGNNNVIALIINIIVLILSIYLIVQYAYVSTAAAWLMVPFMLAILFAIGFTISRMSTLGEAYRTNPLASTSARQLASMSRATPSRAGL